MKVNWRAVYIHFADGKVYQKYFCYQCKEECTLSLPLNGGKPIYCIKEVRDG